MKQLVSLPFYKMQSTYTSKKLLLGSQQFAHHEVRGLSKIASDTFVERKLN